MVDEKVAVEMPELEKTLKNTFNAMRWLSRIQAARPGGSVHEFVKAMVKLHAYIASMDQPSVRSIWLFYNLEVKVENASRALEALKGLDANRQLKIVLYLSDQLDQYKLMVRLSENPVLKPSLKQEVTDAVITYSALIKAKLEGLMQPE